MYVDSLVSFFKKIEKLFNEFKIQTNTIIVKDTKRSDRKAISLTFNASKDNILRLCEYVGYRYCSEKQNKSQIVLEYLKYHQKGIYLILTAKRHSFKTIWQDDVATTQSICVTNLLSYFFIHILKVHCLVLNNL